MLIFILSAVIFCSGCEKQNVGIQCKDRLGCIELTQGEPIKIGVLQALSGKVATLGREQIRGLELALDDRHGKILGRPVSLQIEDTGCSAEGGANAVLKIIADPQHIAIFGTTCSGAAATASKAMSQAGLVMVSGNNSAPFLTSIAGKPAPDRHEGYFRASANEENAGKAAAIYAYNLGIRRAATINDGDIYTRGLTEGFNEAFESMGGEIVLNTSVSKGDDEMEPVMTAVLDACAQLLFFPLFQPEGNHILLQARKMPGFEKIVLMSDGALIDASFLQAVGDKAEGMYFVGPATPRGNRVAGLEEKYIAKYGTSPSASYYLNGYDAAWLLFSAIENASVKDDHGSLIVGRQALRDAMYSMKGVTGVTGMLTCDRFGDCALPVFNVLQLEEVSAGLKGLKSNVQFTYSPEKQD